MDNKFMASAELFIDANSFLETAKEALNECKKHIDSSLPYMDLYISDFEDLQEKVQTCYKELNDGLIKKVDDTLNSLLKLDNEFLNEYYSILSSKKYSFANIDPAQLSDS